MQSIWEAKPPALAPGLDEGGEGRAGTKTMSPAWQAYSLFVILKFSEPPGKLNYIHKISEN